MADNDLINAVSELASTPRLLVALDFDGTLTPFVDDPYQARMIPEAAEPLMQLKGFSDTAVAFVSGRPLESLALVTESDSGSLLVGSHGAEVQIGSGAGLLQLDSEETRRLNELGPALDRVCASVPGAVLERKPGGFGIHTRQVDPERVPDYYGRARAEADRIGGFVQREGKDILEFAVRDTTKGDAISLLRDHVGATGVLFAGDDVTDEDGFAALGDGDVGVKVGGGNTRAAYRVTDPKAFARVLRQLAGQRARHQVEASA